MTAMTTTVDVVIERRSDGGYLITVPAIGAVLTATTEADIDDVVRDAVRWSTDAHEYIGVRTVAL